MGDYSLQKDKNELTRSPMGDVYFCGGEHGDHDPHRHRHRHLSLSEIHRQTDFKFTLVLVSFLWVSKFCKFNSTRKYKNIRQYKNTACGVHQTKILHGVLSKFIPRIANADTVGIFG